MSDYKMEYVPTEDQAQQQRTQEEQEQYEQEYEEWLDKVEEKSKLQREEQDDPSNKGN
tara:strand:+ start:280 stop:453 length:174 start_codon:yes stop_codon:yes gene_type:complete